MSASMVVSSPATGAGERGEVARPLRVLGQPAFHARVRNPYTWLLSRHLTASGVRVRDFSRRRLLRGDDDIWHLHWPDEHLNQPNPWLAGRRAATLLALLGIARVRGKRIVWTVHNLESHERSHPRMERAFWWAFSQCIDGFIAMGACAERAVRERLPALRDAPGFVIPHGHYREIYPSPLSRSAARDALALPAGVPVVAYVGQIRPYKNVCSLVTAFRQLPDGSAVLLIAGSPLDERLASEVRAAAHGDARIRLDLRFLQEDELQRYVRAADLVILPYREVLNSGSAVLALSLDRPVLAPRMGALGELQALVGEEWVRTYEGALTTAHVSDALRWAVESESRTAPPMQALDWYRIARATTEAYRVILDRKRAAHREDAVTVLAQPSPRAPIDGTE